MEQKPEGTRWNWNFDRASSGLPPPVPRDLNAHRFISALTYWKFFPLSSNVSYRESICWVSKSSFSFFLFFSSHGTVIKNIADDQLRSAAPPGSPIRGLETKLEVVSLPSIRTRESRREKSGRCSRLDGETWFKLFFFRVCRHHVRVLHRALDLDGLGNHGNHGYDAALPRGERTRECKRAVRWLIGPWTSNKQMDL